MWKVDLSRATGHFLLNPDLCHGGWRGRGSPYVWQEIELGRVLLTQMIQRHASPDLERPPRVQVGS